MVNYSSLHQDPLNLITWLLGQTLLGKKFLFGVFYYPCPPPTLTRSDPAAQCGGVAMSSTLSASDSQLMLCLPCIPIGGKFEMDNIHIRKTSPSLKNQDWVAYLQKNPPKTKNKPTYVAQIEVFTSFVKVTVRTKMGLALKSDTKSILAHCEGSCLQWFNGYFCGI